MFSLSAYCTTHFIAFVILYLCKDIVLFHVKPVRIISSATAQKQSVSFSSNEFFWGSGCFPRPFYPKIKPLCVHCLLNNICALTTMLLLFLLILYASRVCIRSGAPLCFYNWETVLQKFDAFCVDYCIHFLFHVKLLFIQNKIFGNIICNVSHETLLNSGSHFMFSPFQASGFISHKQAVYSLIR